MTKKKPFTDRRWHDPPAVISLGYVGVSKNEALSVADFMLEQRHITKDEYQKEIEEIEKKYKGIDPEKKI